MTEPTIARRIANFADQLVFDDLPELEADAAYFVEWDPAWATVGGKPLGPMNDGAYWWRFRTPPAGGA